MIFFRLQGFLSSGKNYTLIGGKALVNKYFTTWRWKLQFVTLTLISSSSFLTKITWSQSCLHKNLTFALSLFLGNCNPVDYPRIYWHQFPQKCQKTVPSSSLLLIVWEIPTTSKHSWREYWANFHAISFC